MTAASGPARPRPRPAPRPSVVIEGPPLAESPAGPPGPSASAAPLVSVGPTAPAVSAEPTAPSVSAEPTAPSVSAEPTTLRERLAERAAVTPPQVIVGAIFMNLALGLALFVVAALLGSVLLMIAAAWLLVPMGVNVYLLCIGPPEHP